MDHLQQAERDINRAQSANYHENAMLIAQLAIAHALLAIAERMDKTLQLYDDKQNQLESKC